VAASAAFARAGFAAARGFARDAADALRAGAADAAACVFFFVVAIGSS